MSHSVIDLSPRRAAVLAGIGYLAIFVLAIFANFTVREGLLEPGNATETAANISDSEGLFRLALVAFVVVFVLDVAIAWALYVLFRTGGRDLALLTAWFRLVYTVILGAALVFMFMVLELVSGQDYLTAFAPEQLDTQVLLYIEAFNYMFLIGLVCFGIHLVLLGYLITKTSPAPIILGFILMLAGLAYVVDTAANGLLSGYDDVEDLFLVIVAVPSVIGELWLASWLLLRGGKEKMVLRERTGRPTGP